MAAFCLCVLLLWAGILVVTNSTMTTAEPPQCSYTVTYNNTSGLQIEINPSGNYTLTVFEEGRPQTGKKIQADHLKQIPVGKTGHLKPCTDYSLSVSFINDAGNEIFCNSMENKFRTDPISKGDVKEEISCIPGYVCYGSDWDISSSISTPNKHLVEQCTNDKNTSCVRPANEDICSDLTATFTSEECSSSSFNFTKSISVDFLNPSEIQQIKPTGLPANITTTLPKCKNLSVSYTCSDKHKPDVVKLSELEPFTDYSCTGLILQNNISINKTTPSVQVRVVCDLTITDIKKISSNTSIKLSWTTTSKNCQQELPNLHKLSYDCICQKHGQKPVTSPDGRTCVVTGLIPYADYKCGVKPKYNNEIQVSTGPEVKLQTKVGTPAAVTELKLHVHDHNTIKVSWHRSSTFNGPEGKYIIQLITADDKEVTKKKTQSCTKCEVEFKDLSYSTSYKVKVTAHNGHYESDPTIKDISTFYNDKAVIGFLVFLIILTSVALLLVIYKIYILKRRKSTNDVNDGMELEPIYVNARPPGWRHKEGH